MLVDIVVIVVLIVETLAVGKILRMIPEETKHFLWIFRSDIIIKSGSY